MSIVAFFTIFFLISLIALGGFVVGLVKVWPKAGLGWDWKWALLFMPSAAAVAYILVLWYSILTYEGD